MLTLNFSTPINISQIPQEESWQKEIVDFLKEWYSTSEVVITQTSGSTGTPKKIERKKSAMRQSALMTGRFLNLKTGDTALLCMPARYIAGKMMLVRAIVWRLKLMCIKPASRPLEGINQDIAFSSMVPMQVENSLDRLHQVQKLIIGGAQVALPLAEKLKHIPTDIYESFAMTETVSHIALKKISGGGENPFRLLPDTKIRTDERGCLCVQPLFLDLGEEIITNDLVKILSDNEFEWLGRIDNVINSSGIKIFPEKVEKQLKPVIHQEFIISSEKDDLLGEKVILIVEGEKIDGLEEKIEHFPYQNKYEKPRRIFYTPHFERTPNGKLLRCKIVEKL